MVTPNKSGTYGAQYHISCHDSIAMEDPPILTPALPLALPSNGRLELVARDTARNINRRYSIEASVDLFGTHLVETSWGRFGSWGQSKRFAYTTQEEAQRAVLAHLRRRDGAPRRIGVAYRVVCQS